MAYIGNRPADPTEADNFIVDNFTAGVGFTAGSSTTVTLSTAPATENAIIVTMDGVTQHHDTYAVSGTTLTFDATIPSGITNIEVQYYIKAILTTVADLSVTSGKLAGGAVTAGKIGTGGVSANTQLTAGVVTAHAFGDGEIETKVPTLAKTDAAQSFSAAQRGTINTLGVYHGLGGNTVSLTLTDANHYSLTTNANLTVANPSGINAGQGGSIVFTSNGSYTVSWGSYWRFATGTAPTMSTTAGKQDRVDYYVASSNTIHAVATIDLLGTA